MGDSLFVLSLNRWDGVFYDDCFLHCEWRFKGGMIT